MYLASPSQEALSHVGWEAISHRRWLAVPLMPVTHWLPWIGIRCKQLSLPRLIHMAMADWHQHTILEPFNPSARHLNLQLEEVSSFQHTALQIVEREGRSSQAYVLEDHRLEGNLGEVKYLNAVQVQSVTQRLGATREIAMLSM